MNTNAFREVDPNMIFQTSIKEEDIKFFNPKSEPFKIYGLYNYKDEPVYKRLPDEIGLNVNEGVKSLYLETAGGRLRFSTDSEYVAIKVKMSKIHRLRHMPLSGSSSFDLYVETNAGSHYCNTFMPPIDMTDGYESELKFPDRQMRYITINFPSYNCVDEIFIGLQADSKIEEGWKYINEKPVVYYGSSITQGACSSRPGLTYQNIISRRLNLDYINLGFSGSARGEDIITNYMASLDMSIFVSDYDHNAPNTQHLKDTHCKLYNTIREKHPDIPYIIISRPNYYRVEKDSIERRDVIIETYRYARVLGDKNVYYIDGQNMFRGPDEDCCTVDACHPNDLGFLKMANSIGQVLIHALRTIDLGGQNNG